MAAHRKLWHKGLQRCALPTRKLGLEPVRRQSIHSICACPRAEEAEGATHFLGPGKRGWPPTSSRRLFSRPTPLGAGRKVASFFRLDSAFIRAKSQRGNG